MIAAALFDFGGVISASPFEAFALYEAELGLSEGFLRSLNATNPDSNAWARLERSEIDVAGFCEAFEGEARALGGELNARVLLGRLGGQLRPAMVEAVRRCHSRLKTGLLTNNFLLEDAEAGAVGRTSLAAVLDHFDVVVQSSEAGVRKPDPSFYELACERLGVEPAEAVFLDDLGVNLKPARGMGMTTIKVDDPDKAIAELEDVVGFGLR